MSDARTHASSCSPRSVAAFVGVFALLLALPAAAKKEIRDTPELDAERDKLIEKIVSGQQFEQSVDQFKALVARRDPLIPTSARAQRIWREKLDAKYAWEREWNADPDSDAEGRCLLSVDPTQPQVARSSGVNEWPADWGHITRKEKITVEPENPLAEPETFTVYELQGKVRTYKFQAKRTGPHWKKDFEANVGEFVMICAGGTDTMRQFPPEWQKDFQRSAVAFRLKEPPRIVKKGKWNPYHITNNTLFWAVKDVKWRVPEGAYALVNIAVDEDLGNGRYLIDVLQDVDAVVEVPPTVKNRELMVPGQRVWAIVGNPRFDRTLRKLVLTVEDLEPRYIDPVPEPEE